MAEIGKNAEFVNIGGSASGSGSLNSPTGNVLLDTLAGVPTLMKTLNAENEALNKKSFNDELRDLVASIAEPIKGVLSTHETTNIHNEAGDTAAQPDGSATAQTDSLSDSSSDTSVTKDRDTTESVSE